MPIAAAKLAFPFYRSRIAFVPLTVVQFEPPNMPEIGWFSSTWHPTEDMERFQDSRHKALTCGFSFPTPVLLSRAQPRAHTFDDNHLISGRTPSFSTARYRKRAR